MSTAAAPVESPSATATGRQRLRLLSYNVQVGISGTRPHHYFTKSWKHVLPHPRRFETLDRIAQLLAAYDVVGLQEVDAGSHRTGFVNLTEYLARQAGFPFWHHQLNRDLGRIAQHANGFLSHYRPMEITEHKLPGLIPGRGALMARFGEGDASLVVMMLHLALSRRARIHQLRYIAEVVNRHPNVVVMGDMNCQQGSPEMAYLLRATRLGLPAAELLTYPSWRPSRGIDHILVTPGLTVTECRVLHHNYSDHLPIAMEVALPDELRLPI